MYKYLEALFSQIQTIDQSPILINFANVLLIIVAIGVCEYLISDTHYYSNVGYTVTTLMIIHRKQNKFNEIHLSIDTMPIEQVPTFIFLGITLNETLSMEK